MQLKRKLERRMMYISKIDSISEYFYILKYIETKDDSERKVKRQKIEKTIKKENIKNEEYIENKNENKSDFYFDNKLFLNNIENELDNESVISPKITKSFCIGYDKENKPIIISNRSRYASLCSKNIKNVRHIYPFMSRLCIYTFNDGIYIIKIDCVL